MFMGILVRSTGVTLENYFLQKNILVMRHFDINNFYFLFLLFSDFIGILFSFLFLFLLVNEETCDMVVT